MTVRDSEVRQAIHLARQLIADEPVPVDLRRLAGHLGVRRIEPGIMTAEGYLLKSPEGGTVIRYRDDRSRVRTRFTLAHELGHLILAQAQGKAVDSESFRTEGGTNSEEVAVNRIAAEILMPHSAMSLRLRSDKVNWAQIDRFKRMFDVSTSAVVRRVLEIDGIAALWMRIPADLSSLKADKPTWELSSSRHPRLTFPKRIDKLAEYLRSNANWERPIQIPAFAESVKITLTVASRLMDQHGPPTLWFISWAGVDPVMDSPAAV